MNTIKVCQNNGSKMENNDENDKIKIHENSSIFNHELINLLLKMSSSGEPNSRTTTTT